MSNTQCYVRIKRSENRLMPVTHSVEIKESQILTYIDLNEMKTSSNYSKIHWKIKKQQRGYIKQGSSTH